LTIDTHTRIYRVVMLIQLMELNELEKCQYDKYEFENLPKKMTLNT
jgi:hypothetical protein